MSILSRLRRFTQWADVDHSRAATPPIYRYGTLRQGLTDTLNQPTAQQLVTDGFQSTQAMAARAIANRVGDLELVVTRDIRDSEGTIVTENIDDHPLRVTLDNPNPLLSRRQLLKLTSYWLTQSGEAYWLIVTNGGGRVAELWPMSPANVEKISSDTSPVAGVIFHGEQGETRYQMNEVVWIFDPDPADPFQGVGVVGPQARDFDAGNFASGTLRSHFQKDATPKTVLLAETDADSPTSDQKDAFLEDWQNRYNRREGENLGAPAFLPSGFDIKELSGLSDISAIREFMAYERDHLLMANGVPRSILGDVVDANRAAAETNQFVFDRHTVAPQAGLIADACTQQLARPFYGTSIGVAFADFVSADEDLRLREEQQDLTAKVRTINQVREDRGLDSVAWGEQPIGTFADIPYTGDEKRDEEPGPPDAGSEDPDSGGSGEELNVDENDLEDEDRERVFVARTTARRIAARFTAEAEWNRSLQRNAVYIPQMTSGMRRVFGGQKALIIEALPDLIAQGLGRSYARADWLDALFEGQDFQRLFRVIIDPIRESAAQTSAETVLGDLEQRPALSFNEVAQERMDEVGAELVTFANETTKRALRRKLSEGLGEGASLDDLTKTVRAVMNGASKRRARTIAETEIKHAIQFGQLQGYALSDVVDRKRWNTALDERVRDFELGAKTSHRIDGQTVSQTGLFTLGDGEKAEGPGVAEGGGRLSAHNGINCRCFTTPVVEGV